MARTKENSTNGPTLSAVSLEDIPAQTRKGKASKVIEEFLASGMEAAQVNDASNGFNATLARYIKVNELPVAVITRKVSEDADGKPVKALYLKLTHEGDEVPQEATA